MSFRPQSPIATPDGYRDEEFAYSFDASNCASLVGTIPTRQGVNDIPLLLQPDTEFRWQGFKISADAGGSSLAVQLKDPYGNYLSDGVVPVNSYGVPSGLGQKIGTQPVALESEIICPPGGVVWLYLYNPTTGTYTIDIAVTLYGVKRTQNLRCAA
jgi:hypothetical protein